MSDGTGVTNPHSEDAFAESKGKGKAVQDDVPRDTAMDEDDDEDEDDDDEEDENAEPDEDGLEEIDLNNIVEGGRRTRGAQIDYARAAEQQGAMEEDDEDEDDDDFEPTHEDTEMDG